MRALCRICTKCSFLALRSLLYLVNVHFVFELLSGPEPLRLLMPFAGEKQFKLIPGMFHLFDEKPKSLDFEESSETTGSDW